jgi:DNA topoisomerase-1
VRAKHGDEAARLYELIWMRTVASQMKNAVGTNVTVLVGIEDAVFKARGRTIQFPGFQRAYVEGSDDPVAELAERERFLPRLEAGQLVHTMSLQPGEHATQPPQRYTEASLVKELDKRGIGRPSTWASIIGVLLDRNYAFRKSGSLVPTFVGIAVIQMLSKSFRELVDYEFTARMEDDLDAVSRGEKEGADYLRTFWLGNGNPGLLHLVESGLDQVDPRRAGSISLGHADDRPIEVRIGRYGLFVTDGEHNASLPETTVPDELDSQRAIALLEQAAAGPTPLGEDPDSGKPVYVKVGRFGPYVQLGDPGEGDEKPKMQSLLAGMTPDDVTLDLARKLLALPRDLGPHPHDEEARHVFALTGRYGPFVKWGDESRSIPDGTSVLEITLDEAVALLQQPRRRGRSRSPTALREIGEHPTSKKPVKLMSGRYGPYVTDGEINASLPRGRDPSDVTVAEAVDLLARRAERIAAGGDGKKGARKKATRKKATKKKSPRRKTSKAKAKKKTSKKKASRKKTTTTKASSDPEGAPPGSAERPDSEATEG